MTQAAAHPTAPRQFERPTVGSYLWFAGMVGLWTAFGIVSLASVGKLGDLWTWVTELPLIAEILVWME